MAKAIPSGLSERFSPRPRRAAPRRARLLAVLACVGALWPPAPIAAADDLGSRALRVWDVTFDVLILRPVGAVNSAVGAAFFVPAAILASPGGRDPILEAWDRFVVAPGEYAFTRPLGEF